MDVPPCKFLIRSFAPADLPACQKLYVEGRIGGKVAQNDTGSDIDNIESAYMKVPGNHFWVATLSDEPSQAEVSAPAGTVVGTIGVQHHDAGVGEVRRLRVATTLRRRGIGSALVEQALKFCDEKQYLKITLDTYIDSEPAIRLFERFGFRHDRTRNLDGRELKYFYLDLYKSGPGKQMGT